MGRPPVSAKAKEINRNNVRRWKEKNPDRVKAQRARARARHKEEVRRMDPTGELAYEPLDGVDRAPNAKEPDLPLACFDSDSGVREGLANDQAPGPALEPSPMDDPTLSANSRSALQGRTGIIEPPELAEGLAEELERLKNFRLLQGLHDIRAKVARENGIEIDL